jgi:hypothetical protein
MLAETMRQQEAILFNPIFPRSTAFAYFNAAFIPSADISVPHFPENAEQPHASQVAVSCYFQVYVNDFLICS